MKHIITILMFIVPLIGTAQLFDGEEYEYSSEIIWGINKNTNGGLIGGLMIRVGKSLGDDVYATYGIELSNVKHSSETRYTGLQGQGFIYGKNNYLYAVRLQYGRDKLLFRKSNQQGVQINVSGAVGPTLGFVNPYYILNSAGEYEKFNSATHPSPESIVGPGRLFQGFGESEVVPGLNAKAAMSFEFGTYRSSVAGVEVGVMAEVFTKEIILVSTQPNESLFTSVYFTLYWGSRK